MKNQKTFHFSLGPVQGFIAQARRTRDFWSGSFLLSCLAGEAMLTVIESGGKLILPAVAEESQINDPLLLALQQRRRGSALPRGPAIATLPNRFQAVVPADFEPAACEEAVKKAWAAAGEAVWQRYLEPVAHLGKGTREIWERQLTGFWEISWVVGSDGTFLDRRKNWRSHVPPVEPGDKCTLAGNYQELSGYVRTKERERQEMFWAALRERLPGPELAEDERLCAVALIKRLFPLVAEEVLWRVPQRYPSTPYLAAVPWLVEVCRTRAEEARKYGVKASRLPDVNRRERPEHFVRLREVLERNPEVREFASLDGNCFFEAALQNRHLWEQEKIKGTETALLRSELTTLLKELAPPAAPFYAMLVMDGDNMGALLRRCGTEKVSCALNAFSRKVQYIIDRYNGVTVFAGGDDVLALLPLQDALPAALALDDEYRKSFTGSGIAPPDGTISGAIVYAHYSTPLTTVYREAHRLLDEVAKEMTGRDSLAVAVRKSSGRVLTWAAPWQKVHRETGNVFDPLVEAFQSRDRKSRELNSNFFYNLRNRFEKILAGGQERLLTGLDVVDVLAAEYLRNRERECSREEARERMGQLLRVCRRYRRNENGEIQEMEGITLDGALLVRFLAQKGVS